MSQEAPTDAPSDLSKLMTLVNTQINLQESIEYYENMLSMTQKTLKEYSERLIPEMLDNLGIKDITLPDGQKVSLKDDLTASIPKQYEEAAMSWLDSNNFGAIIKDEVKLSFGKGEHRRAQDLVGELAARGYEQDLTNKRYVHPQTLKAFIKEQLEKGEVLPLDLFGVHQIRKTIIK